MLVLNRKAGDQLIIGPDIVLTVLEVRGKVVKLGCDAPLTVPIRRQEVGQSLTGRGAQAGRQSAEPSFLRN